MLEWKRDSMRTGQIMLAIMALTAQCALGADKAQIEKEMKEFLTKNASKIVLTNGRGYADTEMHATRKKDRKLFSEKYGLFKSMFQEVVASLAKKEYSEEYVDRLKQDTLKMMWANKRMILMEIEAMKKARADFVQKTSAVINTEPLPEKTLVEIEQAFLRVTDIVSRATRDLLADHAVVCDEMLVPPPIKAIAKDLGDGNKDREKLIIRRHLRLYMLDVVEQAQHKIKADFVMTSRNVYYGNSATKKLMGGVKRDRKEITDFLRKALLNSEGQIALMEIRGGLWGPMYDALQYAYANSKQAKHMVKQCEQMKCQMPAFVLGERIVVPKGWSYITGTSSSK